MAGAGRRTGPPGPVRVGVADTGRGIAGPALAALMASTPGVSVCPPDCDPAPAVWALAIAGAEHPASPLLGLLSRHPDVPVLVVAPPGQAMAAMRAGAAGFVDWDDRPADLLSAVAALVAGRRWISPSVVAGLAEIAFAPLPRRADTLSEQQLAVLRHIAAGMTLREIAEAMGVSIRTVRTHRERIAERAGARTTAELVRYAVEQGLLD